VWPEFPLPTHAIFGETVSSGHDGIFCQEKKTNLTYACVRYVVVHSVFASVHLCLCLFVGLCVYLSARRPHIPTLSSISLSLSQAKS
jgi:uncharacterized protein YqhQ